MEEKKCCHPLNDILPKYDPLSEKQSDFQTATKSPVPPSLLFSCEIPHTALHIAWKIQINLLSILKTKYSNYSLALIHTMPPLIVFSTLPILSASDHVCLKRSHHPIRTVWLYLLLYHRSQKNCRQSKIFPWGSQPYSSS